MYPSLSSQYSNSNINFNFNENGASGVADLLSDISALFDSSANLLEDGNDLWAGQNFQENFKFPNYQAPIQPPLVDDSSHPSGSLKTDGNVITTPGGYKIEPMSQFEWKITGPDGKETRVWGDPHVAEGDGGKWDFKRNSTFVLGDGTKINVTTAPWGSDGMTVTSKLEIISGNDRVEVSDIDKGKGKISTITQDGYAHANSFQGDVFVMGQETDDWALHGKEIIGSNNGGESFKTGGELNPRDPRTVGYNPFERMQNKWMAKANRLMSNLFAQFNNGFQPNRLGSNFYAGNSRPTWEGKNSGYNRAKHRQGLAQGFRSLAKMYDVMARLSSLSERVQFMRQRNVLA